MPLTSPGNDDDTGENHQPTLRKNTAEPVEQTLKQNTDWNGLSASAGSTYRPERISSSMAAANDSASARVLNALLLRFLEPSGKVAHQDTRHRFPCPYRAVLNFPGTLAFSGVFIYAAKLFVTELGTGIFTLLPSGNVSRGSVVCVQLVVAGLVTMIFRV